MTTISNQALGSRCLVDLVRTFRNYKALGDRALSQVSDGDLHTLVDPDANSIAVIVKHLAGKPALALHRFPDERRRETRQRPRRRV